MRILITLCLSVSFAFAKPTLEPKRVAGATLMVPAGWSVKTVTQPVPTISIEERAGAADSPSITMLSVPPQAVINTANQLIHTAMPQRQGVGQQQLPDGSMLQVWQGPIGGIPARMAVLARSDAARGIGAVAVFAAPVQRFDALGGTQLLLAVVAGPGGAQPQAQPQVQPAVGRLDIPAAYRRSNMPTLEYIANDFEKMNPAQIAAGLRQFNESERLSIGISSAFGNLLHLIGCQADPSLRLPDGASCAKTRAGWAQTLQFSNGDMHQATNYAQRQRASLQIAARCKNGQTDRASCAAYTRTISSMNEAQHQTMMRVIRNMDPNACEVGEPNCIPH